MALTNRFYGVFDLYLGLNSSFIIITQLFNMYYTHFTLTLLILLMSIKLDTICKYYEKNMVAGKLGEQIEKFHQDLEDYLKAF